MVPERCFFVTANSYETALAHIRKVFTSKAPRVSYRYRHVGSPVICRSFAQCRNRSAC